MKNEAVIIIRKYYLFVFAVLLVAIFLCGTLTVWEKGEYALNYRQYPTVSVDRGVDEMMVRIDGKEYCFHGMTEGQMTTVRKILMYTPLSPIVLLPGEDAEANKQE